MKSQNRLNQDNCNKAKCKTCIFGDTPVQLTQDRINEIHSYLAKFESSHICHTTNKTCYGALEFQAKIMFGMGIIESPTAEALLEKAKQFI